MKKVFTSYSRNDMEMVLSLEQRLGKHALLWRDQEKIYGGDRWPKVLGEAIDANDMLILVWSEHAAGSPYVEFEWCTAFALGKPIIPWLLDSTQLPPSLRASNFIDSKSGEPAIKHLIKSINKSQPAIRTNHSAKVIAELGKIIDRQPETVLQATKDIFNQQNWNVYGHVFQPGGDMYISINQTQNSQHEKPEINSIEPLYILPSEEFCVVGVNFGGYEKGKCHVMIGSQEGTIIDWRPSQLKITVPASFKPGRYSVTVQVDEQQDVCPMQLTVSYFPKEIEDALLRGEKYLLLIAQVEGDTADQLLQADLLEQTRLAVENNEELREKMLVVPWPETFAGPNALQLAQRAGEKQAAQLVLFGRIGESRTFYPRLAVTHIAAKSFARTEERLTSMTAHERVLNQDQHTLSAEPINRPIRLMHFIIGWYQHEKGDYAAARHNFLEVLEGESLTSIDVAAFRFKAGETSYMLGNFILEQPYREEKDVREGENLLREGWEHFKQSLHAYLQLKDRKNEAARVFINLAFIVSAIPSLSTREKHGQAIAYYEKALELIDANNDLDTSILAYGNLAASQEWYASIQWNLKDNDNMLEQSHKNTLHTIELIELKSKKIKELGITDLETQQQIDFDIIWFKNQLAIAIGHLYRGDRDSNLEKSIELSQEALIEFEKQPEKMCGRIALVYNHIGQSYICLNRGLRYNNLHVAKIALEKGQKYVSTKHFPEFHEMLEYNLSLVAALEQQNNILPPYETAGRFEAEFVQIQETGNLPLAEQSALKYLNWTWQFYRDISIPFTPIAHYEIGCIAEDNGAIDLAILHYKSARVVLSGAKSWSEMQVAFVRFLEGKLSLLLHQQGNDASFVYRILMDLSQGYQLSRQFKQEGDRQIESDPSTAIISYDRALSIYPFDPRILVNCGVAYNNQGDLITYLKHLNEALTIYPYDDFARFNRAQIYMATKQWNDALTDLNIAIEVNASEINFHLARAECYEKINDSAKAINEYEMTLSDIKDEEIIRKTKERLKKLRVTESK